MSPQFDSFVDNSYAFCFPSHTSPPRVFRIAFRMLDYKPANEDTIANLFKYKCLRVCDADFPLGSLETLKQDRTCLNVFLACCLLTASSAKLSSSSSVQTTRPLVVFVYVCLKYTIVTIFSKLPYFKNLPDRLALRACRSKLTTSLPHALL